MITSTRFISNPMQTSNQNKHRKSIDCSAKRRVLENPELYKKEKLTKVSYSSGKMEYHNRRSLNRYSIIYVFSLRSELVVRW